MNISISKPIAHVQVVRTPQQLSELTLEYVVINPIENKLTLKLQPIGREITVQGKQYEEIKPALEKALGRVLGPIIDADINPTAPQSEPVQPASN